MKMQFKYTLIKYLFRIKWCIKKGFPIRLILCDIHLKSIPESTTFVHPYGITIGSNTIIGENCVIRQNVTIGQRRDESDSAHIGANVSIGAGVIILGSVKIGDNSYIGAGSVVLSDVPPNSIAVGNPARLIRNKRCR